MERSLSLQQVQVFFRHGARTPLHHIRTPAVAEAFWNPKLCADLPYTIYPHEVVDMCSQKQLNFTHDHSVTSFNLPGGARTGQLTTRGQQEAFDLGKRLKWHYIDNQRFLSPTFSPTELYCRSTFIERTVKSLRCVIAGMFADSLKEHIKDTNPLVIQASPLCNEYLFPNPNTCDVLSHYFVEGLNECHQSTPHQSMKSVLKKALGVDLLFDEYEQRSAESDCPIYYVRDDFVARKSAGFPLPVGLDELLPDIDKLSCEELLWELLGKKEDWSRNFPVAIGRVFQLILCNFKSYNRLPKFHLYSCHDSTLLLILFAMNVFKNSWPPFAADIIFELYKSTPKATMTNFGQNHEISEDDLWLRVMYLDEPVPLPCLWNSSNVPTYGSDGLLNSFVPLKSFVDYLSSCFASQPNAVEIPK